MSKSTINYAKIKKIHYFGASYDVCDAFN